jgi:glutamate synthase (NADPH) small chain
LPATEFDGTKGNHTTNDVIVEMAGNRLLQFVSIDQAMPEKRKAETRRADFDEIYQDYARTKAAEQASRCSQCGVPFCQVHCPLQNNIPDWLKLTAEGRLEEAYEVSQSTNFMPEVCGRICPQDRLCEGRCVIEQSGHGTVTIGAIEKFITDTAWKNGWVKPLAPGAQTGRSVGIIGAGPAGLAAAEALRIAGHEVHIYDRYDRAGGLLIYGIPNFKLEKHVVQRRTDRLAEGGVNFHLNTDIGTTLSFDALRRRHDAILIATGVYKAKDLGAPGSGLASIVPALNFLITSNKHGLGDEISAQDLKEFSAKGRKVVVIGGGDTAMDCVRTAVRQGAVSVTCLYRRDRANMPGSAREVMHAEEEGVRFEWLAAPKAFRGDKAVSAVVATRMRLAPSADSGRSAPVEIPGSEFTLDADLVIKALGFDPEDIPTAFGQKELPIVANGTVKVDKKTKMTAIDGVFAAGDIVRGADLVVWALKEGRDAARGIDRWLLARARTARVAAE